MSYDIDSLPIWEQVAFYTIARLERAIKKTNFSFKVVKTSFRKTCLHMRKSWLSLKDKESESSISVKSKSGMGSFGSGETVKSPNFGTAPQKKRDVKSQRKTPMKPCPRDKRMKFTQSDDEEDVADLSFDMSVKSNATATPAPGPSIATPVPPKVVIPDNVSLSSGDDSLELPSVKPRYTVVEEEKNEVSVHSKKTVTFSTPAPKEMIKQQKPKVYDLIGTAKDKLAALEQKFSGSKKPVFT